MKLDTSNYPIASRDGCALGLMSALSAVVVTAGMGLDGNADAVFGPVGQVAAAVVSSQISRRML
jgi:hypothetical protein